MLLAGRYTFSIGHQSHHGYRQSPDFWSEMYRKPYREFPHETRALRIRAILVALCLASACGRVTRPVTNPVQLEFWNALRRLCGRSFPGQLATVTGSDTVLVGQPLVLNVWQCYHRELRLAFHAGNDHSRVWLITSNKERLRLAHAVHDSAGTALPFSGYAGDALESGTAERQVFHPDVSTLTRVPAARGTSWVLELKPGQRLSYALHAPDGGVRFRVDFDLRQRSPRPPPPWGYTRVGARASENSVNTRSP
jgi:hypothetical protein